MTDLVLDLNEFRDWYAKQHYTRIVSAVHWHHTYRPSRADWRAAGGNASAGLKLQAGMREFHKRPKERGGREWSDIGQHFSIMPDGLIVTGRPLSRSPASIGRGWNSTAVMFEAVGDLRKGYDGPPPQAQWNSMCGLTGIVLDRHGLAPTGDIIIFHKDKAATECPGNTFSKADAVSDVQKAMSGQGDEEMGDFSDIADSLAKFWDDLFGANR